jgi:hypothetical protein
MGRRVNRRLAGRQAVYEHIQKAAGNAAQQGEDNSDKHMHL